MNFLLTLFLFSSTASMKSAMVIHVEAEFANQDSCQQAGELYREYWQDERGYTRVQVQCEPDSNS